MFQLTQEDILLLRQREKTIFVKIEVKDKTLKTLEEISGVCTHFSYEISADSGIRRSANLSVIMKDSRFNINETALFWMDKILYVEVGYQNTRTKSIRYYPVAHFLITENSISYDVSTKEISMSLVDLMSMFTGERGGFLVGYETKILAKDAFNGSEIRIRDAIVNTVVQLGKWNKYRIDDVGYNVPFDIEFGSGVTIFDIIEKLVNLYPAWEFFFDYDGTFICQEIPTCAKDPIMLNDEVLADLIIQEPYTNSFASIFNLTEVFGKCWEADYFIDNVQMSGSEYSGTVAMPDFAYRSGDCYAFTVNVTNIANPTLKINSLISCPIVDAGDKPIPAGKMVAGNTYVVKHRHNKMYLQGQYQIHAIATLWAKEPDSATKSALKKEYNCDNMSFVVNPDNPFTIDKIGIKVAETIDDDVIWLDKDCLERAEYENWKTTVLSNQVSMEIVAVPWLDVNKKIRHKLATQDIESEFIIKNISYNVMEGTMAVDMINFYPLYPYITTEQALQNSQKH